VARILIIDDEKNVRATLARALALEGHETAEAADGAQALRLLQGGGFDLALADLLMPVKDGIALLTELRAAKDLTPVIILTAHATVERAVEALKLGAWDFLEKPPGRDRLLHAVERALEQSRLRVEVEDLKAAEDDGGMIGTGALMDDLREVIRRAAPSDGRILITGESGTGKELVARDIHDQSPRRQGPFVRVNCAAVPETLFESELFGHVRGAFTGAIGNRKGRFERAHGGTLFLDEIGEVPAGMQAKLLRALETGEIERVGGGAEFRVDVRVIAATNRDLERLVKEGGFREDIYYRLNVIPIHVPPLRERKHDIPALAARFLYDCCRRNGLAPRTLDAGALRLLSLHDYPGNVRELRNAIERLAILARQSVITAEDVSAALPPPRPVGRSGDEIEEAVTGRSPRPASREHPKAGALSGQGAAATWKAHMERYERALLLETLESHGWRMAETARSLGLERSHLYKKMKALGITRPAE
jgi:DNA-binding NtrC family response regulator